MSFFTLVKYLFSKVLYLFGYKLMFGDFVFSVGEIFLTFLLLSCSASLLGYLFRRD